MYGVKMMADQIERSLWARRAYSWLVGGFAIVAMLLSAAGVYGIVSYTVSQRTQEIGIRMAVGARPGQVLLEVLRRGMALVAMGTGAGIVGALAATSMLRALLFGVSSLDPFVYAFVTAGVIAVGLLANLVPARRAASVDPLRALHFQ
jgi:ABC-type antimicrobial peptide transport system permease subunit